MPFSKQKEKNNILSFTFSLGLSILISSIFMIFSALVLSKAKDPLYLIQPISLAVIFLSYFVSGFISGKITGKGVIAALIISSIIAVITIGVSLFKESSAHSFPVSLLIRVLSVSAGCFGGFFSVKRKKRKHVYRRKSVTKR